MWKGSHYQHRAVSHPDNLLGHASDEHGSETGPTVGPHDDQIHLFLFGQSSDFMRGFPGPGTGPDFFDFLAELVGDDLEIRVDRVLDAVDCFVLGNRDLLPVCMHRPCSDNVNDLNARTECLSVFQGGLLCRL